MDHYCLNNKRRNQFGCRIEERTVWPIEKVGTLLRGAPTGAMAPAASHQLATSVAIAGSVATAGYLLYTKFGLTLG